MAGTSNAYPELERDLSFHPASNTDPQKLSRQQIRQFNDKGYISPLDVFSPEEADAHRAFFDGILADAMINYLMTLGWTPPGAEEAGSEIFPWTELEAAFRLEDVNKSPAFFDEKKLIAFNKAYIRDLPLDEFVERARFDAFGHVDLVFDLHGLSADVLPLVVLGDVDRERDRVAGAGRIG